MTANAKHPSDVTTKAGAGYRADLTAKEVHQQLRKALVDYRRAERNVVLWFAEVMNRKLYRELGYGSIHQYAEVELGFTASKTSQFVRLSECLDELPRLRESVTRGEVSWTKARELSKVATPRTEMAWIAEAKKSRSRELERKVKLARKTAAEKAGPGKDQIRIGEGRDVQPSGSVDRLQPQPFVKVAPPELVDSRPVEVRLRFTPEQYARYEALMEEIRVQGQRQSREELHLAGLDSLVLEGADKKSNTRGDEAAESSVKQKPNDKLGEKFTRVKSERSSSHSSYQVMVYRCEECGRGSITTKEGPRTLDPATLRTILCDSRVKRRGERNKTSLPPRFRRAALERDRHRCRASGCSNTRFLAAHHIIPRDAGGPHDLKNLITLCASCHRAIHKAAETEQAPGNTWVRDGPAGYAVRPSPCRANGACGSATSRGPAHPR